MRPERSTPGPGRAASRWGRVPAVLVTTAAALLLFGVGVPAASAHDELVATAPVPGSELPDAPRQVELEMSEVPQALGTQVLVSGADGGPVSEGDVEVRGTTVVQPLRAGIAAGTYDVAWRVTSSDGHQLTGTFSFTVTGGTPAAGPAPTAAPDTADPETAAPVTADPDTADPVASGDDGGSSPSPALLVGGAGVLVTAAGLGVRRLRRRS